MYRIEKGFGTSSPEGRRSDPAFARLGSEWFEARGSPPKLSSLYSFLRRSYLSGFGDGTSGKLSSEIRSPD